MTSKQKNNTYEEPEGLEGEGVDIELKEYPLDSFLIRTENRTVYEVTRRIRQGSQYVLDPEFQRDFVWDIAKQSRLIESMMMRIPLPVFYLAETDDGKIVVVDGLQRLNTFVRYLNDEFSLKGIDKTNPVLEGKKFKDLTPKLQNRLEDTQLIFYLINPKVPERARLDIFERVNSGEPLTRQQMRNSLYMGKATKWLKEQANAKEFLQATAKSLNPKTMRDRELINRFCGFYLIGITPYKGEMDSFLADTLKHMNNMNSNELKELGEKFQLSMKNNFMVFKEHAFRKHTANSQKRSIINASLFDVFSVIMTRFNLLNENKINKIKEIFYDLMVNEDFQKAITIGTNETHKVKARFSIAEQAVKDI
jgi:hypothetical protein